MYQDVFSARPNAVGDICDLSSVFIDHTSQAPERQTQERVASERAALDVGVLRLLAEEYLTDSQHAAQSPTHGPLTYDPLTYNADSQHQNIAPIY